MDNRLIDFNHRRLKEHNSAFDTFLSNLAASSYSYNIEALKECWAKLPIQWRDSDKIFIAGAWNVGNILGYDQSGGIITMPFSRDSVAYNTQDLVVNTVSINNPVIDNLYYSRNWGLTLENARSAKMQATSGIGGGNIYNTTINPTGMQISQLATIREITGNTYINRIGAPTTSSSGSLPYSNIGGTIGSTTDIPARFMRVLFDVTDLPSNYRIAIYSASTLQNNRVVFDRNGNLDTAYISTGSGVLRKDIFTKNDRQYLYIYLQSDFSNLFTQNPRFAIGRSPFSANNNTTYSYVGDDSVQVKYGWITYALTIQELEASFIWVDRFNTTAALPVKEEDILTINLTQTSDIFINTSKGAYTFTNQPAGTFDYKTNGIIDCKIYNIAIKHV